MPTIFAHAVIGWTIGKLDAKLARERRTCLVAGALAMAPDLDVPLARLTGATALFAHRGWTHSLATAVVLGAAAAVLLAPRESTVIAALWRRARMLITATAAHGIFDALTNGGSGIAFFAPFSPTRYRAPWSPIPVAPLSARALFTREGAMLILWEMALFALFAWSVGRWRTRARWDTVCSTALFFGAVAWVAAGPLNTWQRV